MEFCCEEKFTNKIEFVESETRKYEFVEDEEIVEDFGEVGPAWCESHTGEVRRVPEDSLGHVREASQVCARQVSQC